MDEAAIRKVEVFGDARADRETVWAWFEATDEAPTGIGPALLAEAGVGPVVAAQLLISWSTRDESAAKLRSHRWLASPRSRQAATRDLVIDTTAAATERSIAPCTPSRSPG